MFERLLKKEEKHDDDMTVWVPKGVYNSVEPLWDKRYAWHPIAVDDSLPMDQTSFIQVDKQDEEEESEPTATASSSHDSLAPEASADTASIHSAISTVGDLPNFTGAAAGQSPSTQPRRSDFGFPVRQMTWNTSRRKRDALLKRQKSRDKYAIPAKKSLAPASERVAPVPTPMSKKALAPRVGRGSDEAGRLSRTAPDSFGGDFVMFAL